MPFTFAFASFKAITAFKLLLLIKLLLIFNSCRVILTTTAKNPLTKNGFVEIDKTNFSPEPVEEYRYPNPTPTILIKESSNYFSEIYI